MTNPTDPPVRGCRAPSIATTGSGPLPPAGRAPTSRLRPRPPHSRRSPARDQLGAQRVEDRQQDRGHLLTDQPEHLRVSAHRIGDVEDVRGDRGGGASLVARGYRRVESFIQKHCLASNCGGW